MARARVEDPLQNFAFALIDHSVVRFPSPGMGKTIFPFAFPSSKNRPRGGGSPRLPLPNGSSYVPADGANAIGRSVVGFKSIGLPSMDIEAKDIDEGNWPFTQSVPTGKITVGDVTLSRALMQKDCDFYVWFMQVVWGVGVPRRNFTVLHLDRDRTTILQQYGLVNCWPKTWKPPELAADSAEVSIEELTMSCEQIYLKQPPPTVSARGSAIGGGGSQFTSFR